MNYGVAIIYYNPEIEVLKQLEVYCKVFEEVLIVDNSDKEVFDIKKVIKQYDKVQYINMNGNQGMSKALTQAYIWANEKKLDFLLTMDQDSIYRESQITNMIQYINKNYEEDVAIYVANFAKMYWDKKEDKFVLGNYLVGENEVKEVDMCLTSTSFINVKAMEQIMPLEDYFISYVDNFISTDFIQKGYRLVRVGTSKFEQQVGESVNNTWYNRTFKILHHKEIRYYYMIRNNYYYRKKFGKNLKIKIKSYLLLWRLYFNILMGEKQKLRKFKACYAGYKDYVQGIKGKVKESSIVW